MGEKKSDTKLTEEQLAAARAWIDGHAPNLACSVCGGTHFFLANDLVTPTLTSPTGGFMIGGASYPQAMVICMKCGNTYYFNAVLMGLAQKDSEKKTKEKESSEAPAQEDGK